MNIPIDKMVREKGFVFLWAGSEHLDDARSVFKKWGLKRCEEIIWIKSNIQQGRKANESFQDDQSFLKRTKEHCLIGINEKSDK